MIRNTKDGTNKIDQNGVGEKARMSQGKEAKTDNKINSRENCLLPFMCLKAKEGERKFCCFLFVYGNEGAIKPRRTAR